MSHAKSTASKDGLDPKNNKFITAVGVVGMLLVIMTFVVGNQYFERVRFDKTQERVLSAKNPELLDLHTREAIALGSYDWIDKDKGVVRIPIERAMELTAKEAAQ